MSTDRQEYMRQWRQENKEKVAEYNKRWREKNREHFNKICRNYQAEHREAQRKRMNEYHQTKEGRATNLLASYVQADLEYRGVRPFLNQTDIIRKCFSDDSKCVYCGETDWTKLGLDRINNDLPHDRWNTVCCCVSCNNKRHRKNFGEFITTRGLTWQEFMEQNEMTFSDYLTIFEPDDEKN